MKPPDRNSLIKHARITTGTIFILGLLVITLYTIPNLKLSQGQTTFPPPIFLKLRSIPSYVVNIPFSRLGYSAFQPSEMAIPVGVTVIWFNDDDGEHTVTSLQNNTNL